MSQQKENQGKRTHKQETGRQSASTGGKFSTGKTKKQPKYTGKAKAAYIGYITLTVISALIVAGYIAFSALSAPPPIDPTHTRPALPAVTGGGEGVGGPVVVQGPSSDRKEEFYTFLLVGQSQETGGSLTDTMMLAAYDVPNQTLRVMSLPRDTYVSYNGRNVLLNTIYTRAGAEDGGIDALRSEVQELTGIYPDYYAIVKWEAFGELVDAIGGVYYNVPRDMRYWDPTQNLRINLKKGFQLLDGNKAMQVVRFREGVGGYIDGDLGRIRTQQSFMKEVVKKCLQPDVLLSNLGDYIAIFQKNVNTNMDLNALTYFVKSAVGGLDMDNVEFVTMPNKEAGDGAHLLALPQQLLDMVNEGFNPYLEPLELGELSIVTSVPIPTPRPQQSEEPTEDPEDSQDPETSDTPGDEPDVPSESGDPPPAETPVSEPTPPPAETPALEPTPSGEDGPMIPG